MFQCVLPTALKLYVKADNHTQLVYYLINKRLWHFIMYGDELVFESMSNYNMQFYHSLLHALYTILCNLNCDDERLKGQVKVKNNDYQQHYNQSTQCTFNENTTAERQLTGALQGKPLIYCRTDLSICNGLAHHFCTHNLSLAADSVLCNSCFLSFRSIIPAESMEERRIFHSDTDSRLAVNNHFLIRLILYAAALLAESGKTPRPGDLLSPSVVTFFLPLLPPEENEPHMNLSTKCFRGHFNLHRTFLLCLYTK